MLRLRDDATGQVEEVEPAAPGRLTVLACSGDLRTRLTADLLRRTASVHRLQVRLLRAGAGPEGDLPLLGVHPADGSLLDGDAALGRAVDVHLFGPDAHLGQACPAAGTAVRHRMQVEPLLLEGRAASVGEVVERGLDPLALRLALLGIHHGQRADLGWADVTAAAEALDGWRAAVATWAEAPSGAMPAAAAGVLDAFSDDLDAPRALEVLRAVETSAAPEGARFEAFAWADRLLGLDLARDVGRS